MAESKTSQALLQLALLQIIATLSFSLTIYVCFTVYEGLSALIGGCIAVLANIYVALKVRNLRNEKETDGQFNDKASPIMMLQSFYRFEVSKVVLTLTMFVIAIFVIKVSILPFIIAYLVAALIVTWLSFLVLSQDELSVTDKRH